MSVFTWSALPHELQAAVLERLPLGDVWSCARASREEYSLCLPFLFHTVHLPTLSSLLHFLTSVPPTHHSLIRHLRICTSSPPDARDAFTRPTTTDPTTPLTTLLAQCTSLSALHILLSGGPLDARRILPVFQSPALERLKKLTIENLDMEEVATLSERLVVSLAFSLPSLESLSLTRITRSALHAPELLFSSVPLAPDSLSSGDDDASADIHFIPAHPLLGTELRLPQLLRLPRLKQLRIRDTHLGDPLWAAVASNGNEASEERECQLEVLDLGSCAYISPAANEQHTARILARVPQSITACALSASLPSPLSPSPSCLSSSSSSSNANAAQPTIPIPPLPRLRTLHLTPLVPTHALCTTLAQPALAGSPVHTLSCAFHPDDAAEGLRALEGFLVERERARVSFGEHHGRTKSTVGGGGRKRAVTRLPSPLCTHGHGGPEEGEEPTSRARSNTSPSSFPSPSSSSSSSSSSQPSTQTIYPSLSTLQISIPSSSSSSSMSPQTGTTPSPKLSPRRIAAARRRTDERRAAAQRLRDVARGVGLGVYFLGEFAGESESEFGFGFAGESGEGIVSERSGFTSESEAKSGFGSGMTMTMEPESMMTKEDGKEEGKGREGAKAKGRANSA